MTAPQLYAIRLAGGTLAIRNKTPLFFTTQLDAERERYNIWEGDNCTVIPVRVVPSTDITVSAEFVQAADALEEQLSFTLNLIGSHKGCGGCDFCKPVRAYRAARRKVVGP